MECQIAWGEVREIFFGASVLNLAGNKRHSVPPEDLAGLKPSCAFSFTFRGEIPGVPVVQLGP